MVEAPNTYRYMNELRQLQDLIKNYPVTSSGKRCQYSIYYVLPGESVWKQVEWPTDDYKRFVKRSEEIIELFEPDALKVDLHIKGKKQEHIIRLIPNKHIPLLDDSGRKTLNRRDQRLADMQQPQLETPSTPGLGNTEYKSEQGLGALQLNNLQKDFDIKLLQRDIDQLRKDNQRLEQENKDLTESLYEYENKADKGKLENLGLLIGAGKLLKMDNQSLMGLAGMLMGGGDVDPNLLSENASTAQKGGGLDLAGDNPARYEAIQTISQFLNNLEEEPFRKVISLLQLIENQQNLVDSLLNYAFQQTKQQLSKDTAD
ncbi:MAG: hypothetical protein R2759_19185 [Bacteroidales bacterium]